MMFFYIEQKLFYKEYCDFFSVEFMKCFGVKFFFVSFVFRGEIYLSMESLMVWSEWYLSYFINSMEDGY